MAAVLALAGDTMLGRGVADRLGRDPPASLVSSRLRAVLQEADATVLNLECCLSDRGDPWPAPGKRFHFRAPPTATDLLLALGTVAVTLANNHALDYGVDALSDTLEHLEKAGIAVVGAGRDVGEARRPAVVRVGHEHLALVGLTDHPEDFAAGPGTPGVAFADLSRGLPPWVVAAVHAARQRAPVLVTPHWGPNMVRDPVPHVRRAADELGDLRPALVAGHSAHVFHGVSGRVLFDLGDFVDDYAVHPALRNDLGLLWLLTLDGGVFTRLDAVPLRLRYAFTDLADGDDQEWVRRRFRAACAALGTDVADDDGRLVVDLR
ncbi:MAG: CapA family protein [Actinomycetes bacterium]